ncbi:MAG: hypothetical protein ABR557_00770 [Pyrinomonadaceae bacterium]
MQKLYPKQLIRRVVASSVLMLLLVCTASAYTVVMRGGKRVEVPASFVVTATTLTYEAGPGVQITLQLAAIDIPATEKANNEPAGALLQRRQLSREDSSAQLKRPLVNSSLRTITNRDLDAAMIRRQQSEVAYEKRRQELGLPSVAESRRRAEAESAQIREELAVTRSSQENSEADWRARASALRTELAAIDAEINYVRTRLEESPYPLTSGFTSFSVAPFISTSGFFGNFGSGRRFARGGIPHRPLVYSAPQFGSRLAARVGFGGGATAGQVLLNNRRGFRHFGSSGVGFAFPVVSSLGVFGSGIQSYDYSYERSALITQFNELATDRAGLKARWRELEDEARRAGAPPGWLRP